MTQGYYAGISGIQSNQYGLDIISDNLANTSTTGYKGTTAEFSDLFSKALSGNDAKTPTSDDIGFGVKLQATTYQLQQGALIPSDRFSDLALEGNGWFGITAKNNTYFTRDGHFTFDAYQKNPGDINSSAERLVTPDGMFVTGTMLTNFAYNGAFDYGDQKSNGVTGAFVMNNPTDEAALAGVDRQGILEFPSRLAYPVEPTTQIQFMGNLGTDDILRGMSGEAISAKNDINQIYLTFTKSAVQPTEGTAWDIVATASSKDGSIIYDTQKGEALFDGSGAITRFNIPSLNNDGSQVAVNLGSGYSGVTSLSNLPISGGAQSDGLAGGILTKYGINQDGIIIADFSNGRQSAIGRVAVYHFQNDQGLNREGGTYFTESTNSGKPLFWTDNAGNPITGATVRSGSLEASNVRMDVGLTDMIIMQRAYQANAKTITTVDEMIQKALQMRR